jgi:hypothetical protein
MENGLIERGSNLPAKYEVKVDIDIKDVRLSRIAVMNGTSDLVGHRKAQVGELRDSETGDLLSDGIKPLEIIIVDFTKHWQISKKVMNKGKEDDEFVRIEAYTPQNANAEYQWFENGVKYVRTRVFQFYCLLPSQGDVAFPYVLSCSKASTPTGKKIVTSIARLQSLGRPLFANVFELKTEQESNDKGTFFIPVAQLGRAATEAEMERAYQWHQSIHVAAEAAKAEPSAAEQAVHDVFQTVPPHTDDDVSF